MHHQAAARPFDAFQFRLELNVNAKFPCPLHQSVDKIRIKPLEGTSATMENRDVCAGAGGDVRELERNVPASNKHNAPRQLGKLQKLIACGEMFRAGDG